MCFLFLCGSDIWNSITYYTTKIPFLFYKDSIFNFTESGQKQRRVFDKEGVLQTAAASDKGAGFGFDM